MLDLRPITDGLARIAPCPWSWSKDADGWWSVKDADGKEVCVANMTRETGPVNGEAIAGMPGTIAALVGEVDRLRLALGFYADPESWEWKPDPSGGWSGRMAVTDGGARARAALAQAAREV